MDLASAATPKWSSRNWACSVPTDISCRRRERDVRDLHECRCRALTDCLIRRSLTGYLLEMSLVRIVTEYSPEYSPQSAALSRAILLI